MTKGFTVSQGRGFTCLFPNYGGRHENDVGLGGGSLGKDWRRSFSMERESQGHRAKGGRVWNIRVNSVQSNVGGMDRY